MPNQTKTDVKELKLTMSKLRPMSAHIYQEMVAQTLKEIRNLNWKYEIFFYRYCQCLGWIRVKNSSLHRSWGIVNNEKNFHATKQLQSTTYLFFVLFPKVFGYNYKLGYVKKKLFIFLGNTKQICAFKYLLFLSE